MDRNFYAREIDDSARVALRKESVDRNAGGQCSRGPGARSLSARRAWIEILQSAARAASPTVALRKESVDRNSGIIDKSAPPKMSLSARRAWIEILISKRCCDEAKSLSARRAWIEIEGSEKRMTAIKSRSPQGERG